MVPEAGIEPVREKISRDFKSRASANSAIPAYRLPCCLSIIARKDRFVKPFLRFLLFLRFFFTNAREKMFPFAAVEANDGNGDQNGDHRMIHHAGGHHKNVVDQPKHGIDQRIQAADMRALLHDGKRKEPRRHHRQKIKGRGEIDYRNGRKSDHENERQRNRKTLVFCIENKADNGLRDREKHDAPCRGRSAKNALERKKPIGEQLADEDNAHITELHSRHGEERRKDRNDIIHVSD